VKDKGKAPAEQGPQQIPNTPPTQKASFKKIKRKATSEQVSEQGPVKDEPEGPKTKKAKETVPITSKFTQFL